MNILITGASGLLGSSILSILPDDYKIYTLGRNKPDQSNNHIEIDFNSDWSISVLPKKMDVVIHLAQSSAHKDFPKSALEIFNVNLASTALLLDYAKNSNCKRFILASTGGIYKPNSSPLNEDSELLGPSELGYYFSSKISSEMIASNYRSLMEVNVLRIFFMFGIRQRPEMFIPSLIKKVLNHETIILNGENGISINPVYVDDVAKVIANLLKTGGPKTINAAGADVITIREIVEFIGKYLNVKPRFQIKEALPNLIANTESFNKAHQNKTISIYEGLEIMLSNFLSKS